jgi:hypothetical protein
MWRRRKACRKSALKLVCNLGHDSALTLNNHFLLCFLTENITTCSIQLCHGWHHIWGESERRGKGYGMLLCCVFYIKNMTVYCT